jgi:GT2 family glycosyltransferase
MIKIHMKDITIVFVNLFMKDDILRAIASIYEDISDCSFNIQITVCDNSENVDNIKEALTAFPGVHYIDCGGNVGFGKANTIGFTHTPSRYYFALNRDTIIPSDSKTIERLIRFMDEHTHIGCIGPKLLNTDGTLQYSCYRFDLSSMLVKPLKHLNFEKKYAIAKKYADRLEMKDFDHMDTRPVDWVLGAAMIVRQEVVDDLGFFDERYFLYLEDCDWCHMMWDAGWPVYYVHDIVIEHVHARASSKVPGIFRALLKNKTARLHLASWCKYIWKWRGKHKFVRYKI